MANPSNINGIVQSGQEVYGVIVDRNDPDKRGRFKVRIMGDQDDMGAQPDDQLQWIQCMSGGQPQLRGNGLFPASYMVGSKVLLRNYGQQGYVISGAVPNNDQNSELQDHHVSATPTSHHMVANFDGIWPTQKDFLTWGNPDAAGTLIARMYQNGEVQTPTSAFKKDPKDGIINQKPNAFGDPKSKHPTRKPIGNDKYPFASVDKVDKEMQALASPELVKNALSMVQNLRGTIDGGLNIPMVDSVGGIQNILGALQSIASMFSAAKDTKAQAQQKKNILESELRRIYTATTNLSPLDMFGNETPEYKTWRAAYLQATGYTETDDTKDLKYTGS